VSFDLYDILGLSGAALFLAAYAGAQLERLDPVKPPALLLNLAGAILILISLIKDFNLGAFVLEAAWGLLALFGIAKHVLKRRATRD
jgi:hypothetical protein